MYTVIMSNQARYAILQTTQFVVHSNAESATTNLEHKLIKLMGHGRGNVVHRYAGKYCLVSVRRCVELLVRIQPRLFISTWDGRGMD